MCLSFYLTNTYGKTSPAGKERSIKSMLIGCHVHLKIPFFSILRKMKQMGVNKVVILCSTGCLALVALIFFSSKNGNFQVDNASSTGVVIERTWELPSDLNEISGMAYLEDSTIAAVQDERGIIFIYNLETSEIEKEVEFGGSGDYEGIAVSDNTAYVLRSDGNLFVIRNFLENPQIQEVSNDFSAENNFEGLFYDKNKEELLMAVKSKDPYSEDNKGIYAFNPRNMEVNRTPSYELGFTDGELAEVKKQDVEETFYPSEINRDPTSGNLLVLEAETPRLLLLDSKGNPLELYLLDEKNFPQPESLTFDEAGRLYISSEGDPATIHRVSLKKK